MVPPRRGTFLISRREQRPHSVEIGHTSDPGCPEDIPPSARPFFSLYSASSSRETALHFFPGSGPRRAPLASRLPSPWPPAEPPACIATSGYSKGSFVFVRRTILET